RTSAMIGGCVAAYLAITLFFVKHVTVPAAYADVEGKALPWSIDVTYQYGFIRCAAGFVLGMLTYRLFIADRLRRWVARPKVFVALAAAVVWSLHGGAPDILTVSFFFPLLLSA